MKNSAVHPFPSKLPPVKPTPKGAFLLKVSMVPLETGVPGAMPLEECNKVDNAQKKDGEVYNTVIPRFTVSLDITYLFLAKFLEA